MTPGNFQQLANFIWSVADLLRGPYRPPQYERVMLPLTLLRRFDAVLAPTKEAVLKRFETLKQSRNYRMWFPNGWVARSMTGWVARKTALSIRRRDAKGRQYEISATLHHNP